QAGKWDQETIVSFFLCQYCSGEYLPCNELTIEHLDPVSYTPEYKYCAVKIERIEGQAEAEVYVQTEYSALKAKLRSAAKG
ncbi:hypothetical protein, partial [Aeromonas allosaccharophila]